MADIDKPLFADSVSSYSRIPLDTLADRSPLFAVILSFIPYPPHFFFLDRPGKGCIHREIGRGSGRGLGPLLSTSAIKLLIFVILCRSLSPSLSILSASASLVLQSHTVKLHMSLSFHVSFPSLFHPFLYLPLIEYRESQKYECRRK